MRLAQITDLHLRQHLPAPPAQVKRHSRTMADCFTGALERIVAAGAEVIAVTGDLLDVPEFLIHPIPDFPGLDLDDWLRRVRADYRLVRERLEAVGLPYVVLPGNHDWEEVFWEVFDGTEHVVEIGGVRLVRFIDREHACHVPRRYDPPRLLWEQMLADDRSPPQVHLQHYVVTPALNERYPHTYEEGEHLAQHTAASGRVPLSLSAHYHPGTKPIRIGSTCFATCPAFCEAPFPWRLFDIDPSGQAPVTMTEQSLGEQWLTKRPAVFIDRDGTLADKPSFRGGAGDIRMIRGAGAALRRLGEAGFVRIMVSSQNAVGRGCYGREVVDMTNDHLARQLEREGGHIDGIRYSTSEPDPQRAVLAAYTDHREAKPGPEPLRRAAHHRRLDLARSWMIGDRLTDVQSALRAGVQPILVRTGRGREEQPAAEREAPHLAVVDDITAAVEVILSHQREQSQPEPD